MDNAGDWLYIVFLIIAGITSVLGSGKKGKRQQQTEDQSGNEMPEVPPMMNRRMRKRQRMVQPEAVEGMLKMPKIPEVFLTAEGEELEARSKATEVQATAVHKELVEPVGEQERLFDDKADLRRAILCAEILNRKYT
ncbi:MAG: hypothetical protein ACI30I_06665 [Parabacteroides sp.]